MILIATASSEVLARCNQELAQLGTILTVADYGSMAETLLHVEPSVILLDFDLPKLNGQKGIVALHALSSATRIIVLCRSISEETELALLKTGGVRGCCRVDISAHSLQRIVVSVQRGELWIRRSLTPRLLDELGATARDEMQPKRLVAGRMVELTHREREIAALVGIGNCNKQIARRLDISERTVKAHLTEIFRKLGVSDRLTLALRVVAPHDVSRESVV